MRWSVEAPGGHVDGRAGGAAGGSMSPVRFRARNSASPHGEGGKRGQELEEIWSYRGHVPSSGERAVRPGPPARLSASGRSLTSVYGSCAGGGCGTGACCGSVRLRRGC